MSLAGLESLNLTAADQLSVVQATAASMGVSQDTLTYLTTVPARRRLMDTMAVEIQAVDGIAIVQAVIPLASTNYTSTDQLYSSVTTNLATAISSGAYNTFLVAASLANNASNTASANCTGAVSSEPIVTFPPSSSSKGLTDGEIAGIVIGTVFGFALICLAVYYLLFYHDFAAASTYPVTNNLAGTSVVTTDSQHHIVL